MVDMAALDRLLSRQHGVVARRQLAPLGFGPRQAESWVRRGQFVPVRRGVYRMCGSPATWAATAMAAVLAAGPGAVLSHRSAARVWRLIVARGPGRDGILPEGTPIEITVPRQCRLSAVAAHRHAIGADECTVIGGLPVTTIERTLLDLADRPTTAEPTTAEPTTAEPTTAEPPTAEPTTAPRTGRRAAVEGSARLGLMVDDALRRRLTNPARLAATLRKRAGPGRRRWGPMRRVLASRGQGYDPGANDWECRMDRRWDRLGLPSSVRQHPVRVEGRTYRLDRAIVELRIGIEWDGRSYHGTRSRFEYDSARRNDLLRAGWLVLGFTPGTTDEQLVATVAAACAERRRLLLLAA